MAKAGIGALASTLMPTGPSNRYRIRSVTTVMKAAVSQAIWPGFRKGMSPWFPTISPCRPFPTSAPAFRSQASQIASTGWPRYRGAPGKAGQWITPINALSRARMSFVAGVDVSETTGRAGLPGRHGNGRGKVRVAGIGRDARAAALRRALAAEPVEPCLIEYPDRRSDASLILCEANGENAVVTTQDCARSLTLAELRPRLDAGLLVLLGNLRPEVTTAFLAEAGRRRILRALSLSPVERIAAPALSRQAAPVRTLGAEGAELWQGGHCVAAVPAPRIRLVDPTGAGDCFLGTLLASMLRRGAAAPGPPDLEVAAWAGSVAAARKGTQAAFPDSATFARACAPRCRMRLWRSIRTSINRCSPGSGRISRQSRTMRRASIATSAAARRAPRPAHSAADGSAFGDSDPEGAAHPAQVSGSGLDRIVAVNYPVDGGTDWAPPLVQRPAGELTDRRFGCHDLARRGNPKLRGVGATRFNAAGRQGRRAVPTWPDGPAARGRPDGSTRSRLARRRIPARCRSSAPRAHGSQSRCAA
jgi:ribokinase